MLKDSTCGLMTQSQSRWGGMWQTSRYLPFRCVAHSSKNGLLVYLFVCLCGEGVVCRFGFTNASCVRAQGLPNRSMKVPSALTHPRHLEGRRPQRVRRELNRIINLLPRACISPSTSLKGASSTIFYQQSD